MCCCFFTFRLGGKNILFLFRNVSSNNTSQTPAASPYNLPTSSDSCEPPAKKKCTSGLLCIIGHCLSALLRYNVETNIKPSIIMTKDYAQCQNPQLLFNYFSFVAYKVFILRIEP